MGITLLRIPAKVISDIFIREPNNHAASVIQRFFNKALRDYRKYKWNITVAEDGSDTLNVGNSDSILLEGESPLEPLHRIHRATREDSRRLQAGIVNLALQKTSDKVPTNFPPDQDS